MSHTSYNLKTFITYIYYNMRALRNYNNPSNSKSINWDKNRDLQEEMDFFLQECNWYDISKTRVHKKKKPKTSWNEYKHHVISHGW